MEKLAITSHGTYVMVVHDISAPEVGVCVTLDVFDHEKGLVQVHLDAERAQTEKAIGVLKLNSPKRGSNG